MIETYIYYYTCRYVRVKRQNQTFFIPCLPDDKIQKIKSNIVVALKGSERDSGVQADQMRLLLPNSTVLEDDQTLNHYEIKNDDVLHVVFQITENQWEAVCVDSTDISSTAAAT